VNRGTGLIGERKGSATVL